MTERKIVFIKKNIDKSENNLIELSVQKFEFDTKTDEKKEIEKIIIKGSLSEEDQDIEKKGELDAILNDNNLELSFDNDKVRIKVKAGENLTAVRQTAANAAATESGEDNDEIAVIEVKDKTLAIEWNSGEFQLVKQTTTETTSQNSDADKTSSQKKVDEIDQKLKDSGVKIDELGDELKTIHQDLKDGKTEEGKVSENGTKVINGINEKASEKKLDDFTTRVNNIIKNGKKDEIENLKNELDTIISNNDYQSKKSEFEALNEKLKAKISGTNTESGNDWLSRNWKVGFLVIVVVALVIGLIVYFRQGNTEDD